MHSVTQFLRTSQEEIRRKRINAKLESSLNNQILKIASRRSSRCARIYTTAPNDTSYNDRFAEIFTDTLAVQSMCELGGDIGAAAAGVYASKKAETYMETAVKESAELSFEDDFNMEVMRQNVVWIRL